MHHCRIVLRYAMAAAVLLCMLSVLSSKNNQLKVRDGPSVEFRRHQLKVQEDYNVQFERNHASNGSAVIADVPKRNPVPKRNRVWLYSLIGTDFPGAATLLQHWLRHYADLGFRPEQMILVVHTRSNGTAATDNLARVVSVLRGAGMAFERWTGTPYSSDAHLEIKLRLMHERIRSLQDWIVVADSDEFYDFDALGPGIQKYVGRLEAANASFGAGVLVDRVAEDASVPDVLPEPSLSEQFALHCAVVRHLTQGFPYKVVAFKAYLRTNTGNHKVVSARTAAKYFGPTPPGERSPRGGFYGAADVYNLTPYSVHPNKYARAQQQPRAVKGRRWSAAVYPKAIAAMHFKWHSGVLQSASERLHHYRGDGGNGMPRYQHFVESERILAMLANGSVPIESAACFKDMPWRVKRLPRRRKMYI